MQIAMVYLNNPPFQLRTHQENGLGGSESGFINTVKELLKLGCKIDVFNQSREVVDYGEFLQWRHIDNFNYQKDYDVVYSLRHKEVFDKPVKSKLKVLFMADTESHGLGDYIREGKIDVVMFVSHWQKEKIAREEQIPDQHCIVTSNGIDDTLYSADNHKPNSFIFAATPDRGLDTLLDLWPRIKEVVPDATLKVYSSFMGWGMSQKENSEALNEIYMRMNSMASLHVVNNVHGNAQEIRQAISNSEYYIYPSNFYETRCMSVLESMFCGTIPIVTGRAALLEAVVNRVTGFVVPAYGCETERYRLLFLERVKEATSLALIQKDLLRTNMLTYASQFTYSRLVTSWLSQWKELMR